MASAKALVQDKTGRPFPQDPSEQLRLAVNAVFDSWFAKKAVDYRRIHRLPDDWGTAVTVMAMVFGNLGDTSGTGVCFSRDPSSGERRFFGEFLVNAQGEDVVAGIRTPEPLAALETRMPKVYAQLVAIKDRLEKHYRDMQDMEFTVQEGRLHLLQTRSGKRTAGAAVRIAVEMVRERLIDREAAVRRVDAGSLQQLLVKTVDPARQVHRARPRGWPPPRPPPPAPWSSTPTGRWRRRFARKRSSSSARRPRRRTWPACTPRRASSPPAAASPRTRRWWPAAGARPASSARARWWSTRSAGSSGWAARWCARGRPSR